MKKRSEADSKYTWKLEDMVAEDSPVSYTHLEGHNDTGQREGK